MYTRPWYVHLAGYLHLARGSGTRAVTRAPPQTSHWRWSVHVAELWAEGQVEGVHVVTAIGLQQTSHTKKQQQSCLEGQCRLDHAPHPAAAVPVASTPAHVISTTTSLTNLAVFGPHPPPEMENERDHQKICNEKCCFNFVTKLVMEPNMNHRSDGMQASAVKGTLHERRNE